LSLKAVLKELGKRGVTSLMVEGGGILGAGFLKAGLVDKVLWFTAPLLIGGDGAASLGELGVRDMSRVLRFKEVKMRVLGTDMLIEGCF
jgi:diaminohydroxyphosphoribosylaminopyrimidine deaminase/5-amino-6-(5-phosphoribosylamino)uracil reductase